MSDAPKYFRAWASAGGGAAQVSVEWGDTPFENPTVQVHEPPPGPEQLRAERVRAALTVDVAVQREPLALELTYVRPVLDAADHSYAARMLDARRQFELGP